MAKHGEISSHLPHFFRIILPHILENGTLELPRNFVKEHGKHLSMYARLELPTGTVSKMELKRCNGRAWLHQGWRDFVEKYSIQCGYFLLFRYKGGSCFNVLIFDLSTSEIEYPVSSARTCNKKAGKCNLVHVKEEHSDDVVVEILDKWPQKVHKGRGMGNANQARHRVPERAKAFQSPNLHFIVAMTPAYVNDSSYLHIPVGPARSYLCKKGNNRIYLNLNGRTWSMKYTIGVPPQCPVRIHWGWTEFSRENHLQEGDICVFELVDSKALLFKVTIFRITDEEAGKRDPLVMPDIAPHANEQVSQAATVKRKADHVERDLLEQKSAQMNIDERDILCDFLSSFMKRMSLSWSCNPSETPKEMQIRKRKRPAYAKESPAALERAKTFKCKDSCFTVVMRGSYVQDSYRLVIPNAHSSIYLMDQHGNEAFLCQADGEETWPVNIYVHGSKARFSSGWKDFVVDNNLQQGDACVFELLTQGPNYYKVTIFRVAEL